MLSPLAKLQYFLNVLHTGTTLTEPKRLHIETDVLTAIKNPVFPEWFQNNEGLFWKILRLNNATLLAACFTQLHSDIITQVVNRPRRDGVMPMSIAHDPHVLAILSHHGASRKLALSAATQARKQRHAINVIEQCSDAELEEPISTYATPLWQAIEFGCHDVISALCARKAGLKVKQSEKTVMDAVIEKRNYRTLFLLHTAGLMPSIDNLHAIAYSGHALLLRAVCPTTEALRDMVLRDTQDANGRTLLHTAAQAARSRICALLCHAGARVDATDRAGRTPLQLLFQHKNRFHDEDVQVVNMLVLGYNASLHIADEALRLKAIDLISDIPYWREEMLDRIRRANPGTRTIISRGGAVRTFGRMAVANIPSDVTSFPLGLFSRLGWCPEVHARVPSRGRTSVLATLSLVTSRRQQRYVEMTEEEIAREIENKLWNPLCRLPRELLFAMFEYLLGDLKATAEEVFEKFEKCKEAEPMHYTSRNK